MKVLITGNAGLLGSRLASYLVENNISVLGIDNFEGGYNSNVHPSVIQKKIDLVEDVESIHSIFTEFKPDYVYHMAAYAAEGLSPFIRSFNYKNNLVATSNIVNQCIMNNVKRLVFTSTMAVYGDGDPPFDETHPRNPIDPYGIAKMACEMDIEVAGKQHGLDWCIVRPHNFYGVNQNIWDKYRNVLGIWMYRYLNDEAMLIYGDGKQSRAFSYVDDSILPLWKAATEKRASKEIINLGGIREYSLLESCKALIDVIGDGRYEFAPARHEVKKAIPTWEKSVDILGFEHKTDLREGLSVMWDWAKKQPMRRQKLWDSYELDKGLYPYWEVK